MLSAKELSIGYEKNIVVEDFNAEINKGEIISIIGPNGSGKSTVLKVISRLISKESGHVSLCGKDIFNLSIKELARKMSVLSQDNTSPEDITVEELVYFGRMPHKKWYESRAKEDDEIVEWALQQTRMTQFRERKVTRLSGGQKQKVWIAMALAQKPEILLLDEPTTYLDICHQLELMELVKRLNRDFGITVIMVLHDLNQAVRYSHRMLVLKDGKLYVEGSPEKVLTKEMLREVYNVEADVTIDTQIGKPVFLPLGLSYLEA